MLNIGTIIGKFVKNSSQRELGRLKTLVDKINQLEPTIKKIPDGKQFTDLDYSKIFVSKKPKG